LGGVGCVWDWVVWLGGGGGGFGGRFGLVVGLVCLEVREGLVVAKNAFFSNELNK